MTNDDSPQDKPSGTTDEQSAESIDTSSADERTLTPDYGAFAGLDLDHESVDSAKVVTSILRGSSENPFGVQLTVSVGPVTTDITLDPETTAELAEVLSEHHAELDDAGGQVDVEVDLSAADWEDDDE